MAEKPDGDPSDTRPHPEAELPADENSSVDGEGSGAPRWPERPLPASEPDDTGPRRGLMETDPGLLYRRIGAYALDAFFIALVTIVVGIATGVVSETSASLESAVNTLALWEVAAMTLYRWSMHAGFGGTLGKLALRIRVVNRDGRLPGPIVAIGREAVFFVVIGAANFIPVTGIAIAAYVAYIANILIVMRRADGRAIHDLLVGTRVVRLTPPATADVGMRAT